MTYYKALRYSYMQSQHYRTPQGYGAYDPNDHGWQPLVGGTLVPCSNGYHIMSEEDILYWDCPTLWIVEPRGDVIQSKHKSVCHTFRFVEKVEAWKRQSPRLLACDIVEHVYGDGIGRLGGATKLARAMAVGHVDAIHARVKLRLSLDLAWFEEDLAFAVIEDSPSDALERSVGHMLSMSMLFESNFEWINERLRAYLEGTAT